MPIIHVNMFEGRTEAVEKSLDVKPETVRIFISESPKHHVAVGGVLVSEMKK